MGGNAVWEGTGMLAATLSSPPSLRAAMDAFTAPVSLALDGLRALLPPADGVLAAAGVLVFGAGRLLPSAGDAYEAWYPALKKPTWNPPG